MKDYCATVKQNKQVAEGIYMLTVELDGEAPVLHGGQFLNISVGDDSMLLRRPLGVCKAEGNQITVCYQVKGRGTERLKEAKAGDTLNVLLPLGNGFNLDEYKNIAVIGGGVGIFPLIATIREHFKRKNFYSYIGFRNQNAVCLLDELERSKQLFIATDDGSYGKKGNAVDLFFSDKQRADTDVIIACGPPIMLKVLKQKLEESGLNTPCFVSLEERMGCGVGACLVCTCKTADGKNARVCKDGPVFNIKEVTL